MDSRELGNAELLIFLSQKKSPGLCALVELLGNFFGFSGLGIMLAGNVGLGIVVLVGYWFWLTACVCMGIVTFGLGFGLVPIWWLVTTISALQTANTYNATLVRTLLRQ